MVSETNSTPRASPAPQTSLTSDIENESLPSQQIVGTRSEAEAPNHKRKGREDAEAPSTNAQGDHRHSGKRQKYCNDRSTNIAETWNEPESSCIGQYPSRDSDDSDDSDDQTHRMVRSIEETLKGPEKKVYASVKRRIQVFAFHEHPFGLKGSTIAEWWTEAAEKLKDDQPNAKINTTLHQIYYRPRSVFLQIAKRDIKKWYGLDDLAGQDLQKQIYFLLDEERYVCPQKYYQTPQSYFKALALASLLRAGSKKKSKSSPGLEFYHTEGRAPLFLATILHQALGAAKGGKPSKTAEKIYDQHLATWENTSRTYQKSVNQELRDRVERMERLKDIEPRREISDPDARE